MPLLGTTTKQPSEIENYSVSYSEDLDPVDSIVIQTITVIALDGAVTGLPVIDSYLVDPVNQKVKMFISGGTAGSTYKVTVRVQTDTGRVLEDEFKLRIKEY